MWSGRYAPLVEVTARPSWLDGLVDQRQQLGRQRVQIELVAKRTLNASTVLAASHLGG
jgi:hypothetical protein